MLLYVEKKAKNYPLAQEILHTFPKVNIIEIQHYKDLFDKTIGDFPIEKCIILAKQESISILPTPPNYGFPNSKSFFFKPSINCVFNCAYCYLKTMFKNRFPVIFVNYEDMKEAIQTKIQTERKSGYTKQLTFYASNYSDLRAIESFTHFHQEFIPFFEQFDNVVMETRTKSATINLLTTPKNKSRKSSISPRNTELAFSLSPASIAEKYEPNTASLQQKLQIIKQLLNQGYRVGLRFLPLIPVENYLIIYQELIDQVKDSIDINKIASIGIAPLIENKEERNADILTPFELLFKKNFPNANLFRDYQ